MPCHSKWFTCTPVRFVGDQTFFARDSGLLCKGFQEIGVDCKAIMPGPPMDVDLTEDLIRTDYKNLEDPEWWRSLGGEGVVFYAWGDGKYLSIARAIKKANLILVTNMDTGAMIGIANGIGPYIHFLANVSTLQYGINLHGLGYFLFKLACAFSVRLIRSDLPRSRHLKQADIIGAVCPIAADRLVKVCQVYGGGNLASKVKLIPHPTASYMCPDPLITRERLVVAVGRWEDEKQKKTTLLLASVKEILSQDDNIKIEIFGRLTAAMKKWHESLTQAYRSRVSISGIVPNFQLRKTLQQARILLSTSSSESFHIASAEALCCGCSLVGTNVPAFPSMKWFTDGPFGRMAPPSPSAIAIAVIAEMNAWDEELRNPTLISKHWKNLLDSSNVAQRILDFSEDLDGQQVSKHA